MCQENLSFISIQCTIFLYICTALSTYMHSTKAYVVHKTQHCQPCLTNLLSAYIRHCHHQSYWYTTRCHLPKTSLIIHKTQCCSYGIKTFSFSINLKLQGHQPLRKVLSLPCPFSVVWHTHHIVAIPIAYYSVLSLIRNTIKSKSLESKEQTLLGPLLRRLCYRGKAFFSYQHPEYNDNFIIWVYVCLGTHWTSFKSLPVFVSLSAAKSSAKCPFLSDSFSL
jgi:hypothetical protein